MPLDLRLELFGELLAVEHVRAARVGGDGEPGRDGDPELRHLGQAHALAAEQLPPALGRLVEVVDEAPVSSHREDFPTDRATTLGEWR